MKSNLIKIGLLSLGLFGFGLILSSTKAAEGVISLTILPGVSSCTYGTSLNFGAKDIEMDQIYSFTGTFPGQFSCIDRNGSATQRSLTIIADDLSAAGLTGKIGSGNVKIFHSASMSSGNIEACTGHAEVLEQDAIPLSGTYTLLQRIDTLGEGVCSVAVPTVGLKIDVPVNQAPGTYTGTLTLDISL